MTSGRGKFACWKKMREFVTLQKEIE